MHDWYYNFKKTAAPLPDVVNEYPKNNDDEDRPGGIEKLDELLTQEHAKKLTEPDSKYLGAGFYGTAFQTNNPDRVRKLTTDISEAKQARIVMNYQRLHGPLPYVAYVFSARDLSQDVLQHQVKDKPNKQHYKENYHLYEIVTEKVTTLTHKERVMFNLTFRKFYYSYSDYEMYDDTELMNMLEDNLRRHYHLKGIVDAKPQQNKPFLQLVINFIRILKKHRVLAADMHGFNIGKRKDGSLVVLDLGAINLGAIYE